MRTYIFSRPVHSGKTTELSLWCSGRNDVAGVLMPDLNGQRHFQLLPSGMLFPINDIPEDGIIQVGRFSFSNNALQKVIQSLTDMKPYPRWLLIDEIGKWELAGGGFAPLLHAIQAAGRNGPENLLLVVREGLLSQVLSEYRLENATVLLSLAGF